MTNKTTDQQPQAVGIAYWAPLSSLESGKGRIVSIYETATALDDPQKLVSVPYLHLQSFREWFSNLRGRQLPASKCSTDIVGMSSKVPCWFVSDSEDPFVTNNELRGKFLWKTTPPKKLRQLAKEKGLKNYGPMLKKEDFEKIIERDPDSSPILYRRIMRKEALGELPKARKARASLGAHVWELRARAHPGLRQITNRLGTKMVLGLRILKDLFMSLGSASLLDRIFLNDVDDIWIRQLIWGIATLILAYLAISKTISYFKLPREIRKNRKIYNGSSKTDFWRNVIYEHNEFEGSLKSE